MSAIDPISSAVRGKPCASWTPLTAVETAPVPVLLMLDEFAALGRLDFFESQLAFMAGYGIRSFLITQSLNQLERAYGANHAIVISALRFRQMTSAPQSACRMRSGPPPKCAR